MQPGDLIFYHNTDPISTLIQMRTDGPFNHVAVVATNATVIEAHSFVGVRERPIKTKNGIVCHTSALALLPIIKIKQGLDFCRSVLGDGYDYMDILMFGWALLRPKGPFLSTPGQYTCSELATGFLIKANYQFEPNFADTVDQRMMISPNSLAFELQKNKDIAWTLLTEHHHSH